MRFLPFVIGPHHRAPVPDFRILVVDDESTIVDLFATLLERAGYTCAKAFNGRQALELADTFHPHLIFMNVVMPQMLGFEAAARISGFHTECDIVFFSGHADELPLYEALNRYGYTFPPILPKPIHLDKVLQIARDTADHLSLLKRT